MHARAQNKTKIKKNKKKKAPFKMYAFKFLYFLYWTFG